MSERLKLVFAGTPDFAAVHLQSLLDRDEHQLIAVYCQPDRPAGRGKKIQSGPVKQIAERAGLPVYQPLNFKQAEDREALAALGADLMVVVAYGLLLPQSVLDTPRLGCINVHGSILPRWRGAAPVQRAIEAGDSESGITIMQMDAGLDTGDTLHIERCAIEPTDTSATLFAKLSELGPETLHKALAQIAEGRAQPVAQNDTESCYAKKIDKAEAEIDWQRSATELDRQIRAFVPFPVCFSHIDGQRLKIHRALTLEGQGTPGEILAASSDGIEIACGTGSLLVQHLQLPNARAMSAADMLNARRELFAPGRRLGDGTGNQY